jgi:hypothetical protein
MLNFSVTKNGKELDKNLYSWNEENRTFSSNEYRLVLDFSGIGNCTFNTRSNCTFNTGHGCTFNTGFGCTFKVGHGCTFNTGSNCTFKTGYDCVVVRKDIFEVIQLLNGENHIKLNGYEVKGYVELN